MSQEKNIGIAQRLLAGIGEGKDPDTIAAMFSEDVVFEVPGDEGVLPWIGRKTGRSAVADFIRGIRSMTEPVKFDIQEVLASDARAVIVGELATRIKATGKVIRPSDHPDRLKWRGHALPNVGGQFRCFAGGTSTVISASSKHGCGIGQMAMQFGRPLSAS